MAGISNRNVNFAKFYSQLKILVVVSSPFVKRAPESHFQNPSPTTPVQPQLRRLYPSPTGERSLPFLTLTLNLQSTCAP
jgi:hypothetical protein